MPADKISLMFWWLGVFNFGFYIFTVTQFLGRFLFIFQDLLHFGHLTEGQFLGNQDQATRGTMG
jgi:hypothetical protein